jgi:hypothetical protein
LLCSTPPIIGPSRVEGGARQRPALEDQGEADRARREVGAGPETAVLA